MLPFCRFFGLFWILACLVSSCHKDQLGANYDLRAARNPPSSALALESWIGPENPRDSAEIPFGLVPLTQRQPSVIISRSQYLSSWNEDTRLINWTSWVVSQADLGHEKRSPNFIQDKDLDTYLSPSGKNAVVTAEYNGTCFDRGHQVPSKDRTDNPDNNEATFLMSNIIPQTSFLNRLVWERLESATRDLLETEPDSHIWVLAGPIFTQKIRFTGSHGDIAVPDANFKIVVDLGSRPSIKPKLIAAVIMPNVTSTGDDPVGNNAAACNDREGQTVGGLSRDWHDYEVGLTQIETEAGIDLGSVNSALE